MGKVETWRYSSRNKLDLWTPVECKGDGPGTRPVAWELKQHMWCMTLVGGSTPSCKDCWGERDVRQQEKGRVIGPHPSSGKGIR